MKKIYIIYDRNTKAPIYAYADKEYALHSIKNCNLTEYCEVVEVPFTNLEMKKIVNAVNKIKQEKEGI